MSSTAAEAVVSEVSESRLVVVVTTGIVDCGEKDVATELDKRNAQTRLGVRNFMCNNGMVVCTEETDCQVEVQKAKR